MSTAEKWKWFGDRKLAWPLVPARRRADLELLGSRDMREFVEPSKPLRYRVSDKSDNPLGELVSGYERS